MTVPRVITVAVLLLALAVPAAASASSVELRFVSNEQTGPHPEERTDLYELRYVADPGEANQVTITDPYGAVRVADAGATIRPGQNCRADGDTVVCRPPTGIVASDVADLGDGDDTVTSPGRMNVTAGPGDDRIAVAYGRIDGGPGADVIEAAGTFGTAGVEVNYADRTAPVSVTIDDGANDGEAGEGDDVRGPVSLTGGAGDDTLVARATTDPVAGTALSGGPGNDRLTGSGGNDGFNGGDGDDVMDGGGGADSFSSGPGADVMRGGPGYDSIWYGGRKAPMTITLDDLPGDGEAGENDDVGADIESVTSGDGDDVLVGNDGDNQFNGGYGADRYVGAGGNDSFMTLGPGDVADGGPGDDRFLASTGSTATGGPGKDFFLVAAQGPVRIFARDGEADSLSCSGTQLPAAETDELDTTVGCLPQLQPVPGRKARPDRTGVLTLKLRMTAGASAGRPWKGTIELRRVADGALWARVPARVFTGATLVKVPLSAKALRTLRARGPTAVTVSATPTANPLAGQARTTASTVLLPAKAPKKKPRR